MRNLLPESLLRLAAALPAPLYLVGGSVRDSLMGRLSLPVDFDLAAPLGEEVFLSAAQACGFAVRAVYRNTGTVKIERDGIGMEYTRFRTDRYARGTHAPCGVAFTDDIAQDARRRDFRANAVYYDVANDVYCDPLGGRDDIAAGLLRTTRPAAEVFGEDGLRLMRLSRLAAETGLSPDAECIAGAREHCALIGDIVPERVFSELSRLLHADGKGGEPYRGLVLLRDTGVLGQILPELSAGAGLPQPPAFHDHDVLEHSLRAAKYAAPAVRFAALLHDVGKPFCYFRDGNYHAHAEEGARIAGDILTRLKAPRRLTDDVTFLVKMHMVDLDGSMRESKVRKTIVSCKDLLPALLALKQADYSACKDDLSPAPCVTKWTGILDAMKREGAPLCLKELAVDGDDLLREGVPPREIGAYLNALFESCVLGAPNRKPALLKRVRSMQRRKSCPPSSS